MRDADATEAEMQALCDAVLAYCPAATKNWQGVWNVNTHDEAACKAHLLLNDERAIANLLFWRRYQAPRVQLDDRLTALIHEGENP